MTKSELQDRLKAAQTLLDNHSIEIEELRRFYNAVSMDHPMEAMDKISPQKQNLVHRRKISELEGHNRAVHRRVMRMQERINEFIRMKLSHKRDIKSLMGTIKHLTGERNEAQQDMQEHLDTQRNAWNELLTNERESFQKENHRLHQRVEFLYDDNLDLKESVKGLRKACKRFRKGLHIVTS